MLDDNVSQNPTLDDYRWLLSRRAEPWLRRAAESRRQTLAVVQSLRRDLSSSRMHLVLEQTELRRRAREKFTDAGRMFFTRTGLEQATDQLVAAYKARRFPNDVACVDLCCGMGGDLAALAGRTPENFAPVLGVDRDRVVALMAAANVGECGGHAGVVVADASGFPLPETGTWHLDPDRRPSGRRTTRLEWHSPNLKSVERLIERSPHGAIKLAPGADVPDAWLERVELEWISRRRQCRQLVVWFGRLAAAPGRRRATLLRAARLESVFFDGESFDGDPTVHSIVGLPRLAIPAAEDVGGFVFEPDPAVLAADLAGALAARHGLQRLAAGSAYLTSQRPLADPLAACFQVEEVMPFDRKRLKRLLAGRGIRRLEIKQRGLAVDPERLRRELRVGGARTGKDGDAVLILAKRDSGSLAVLARRMNVDDR